MWWGILLFLIFCLLLFDLNKGRITYCTLSEISKAGSDNSQESQLWKANAQQVTPVSKMDCGSGICQGNRPSIFSSQPEIGKYEKWQKGKWAWSWQSFYNIALYILKIHSFWGWMGEAWPETQDNIACWSWGEGVITPRSWLVSVEVGLGWGGTVPWGASIKKMMAPETQC